MNNIVVAVSAYEVSHLAVENRRKIAADVRVREIDDDLANI